MARRTLALLVFWSLASAAPAAEVAYIDGATDVAAEEHSVQWLEQSSRRRAAPHPRPSPRPSPPPYDVRRRAPTPTPYDVRRRAPTPPPYDVRRRATPSPTPTPYDVRRRATPSPTPTDSRRRATPSPTPTPSTRRRGVPPQPAPTPNPPPGDNRRRNELRRRGSSDPLPSDCCGGSGAEATRRRGGSNPNSDRVDSMRRRNNERRRSSNGWYSSDYSRRRGFSPGMYAGLGFAGGIALGVMISQPGGHSYYYHQQGWTDMYGVYHPVGYYSPSGYHYQNAQAIGYCPPNGAPDYDSGCGHAGEHPWVKWVIVGCIFFCCCACILGYVFISRKRRNQVDHDVEFIPNTSYGGNDVYADPITREGQPVPRADASAFLQAVEAEYVFGAQGEVGRVFDSRHFLQEVQQRLDCEEAAVRDARDPRRAVRELANRWGMIGQLNGS